jgi:tetratricopeptide (TPR) repeat protein
MLLRDTRYSVLPSFVVCLLAASGFVWAGELEDCTQSDDLAAAIAGCTKVADAGWADHQQMAMAYNNRGNARAALGEHAEALEDYGLAIVLSPDYANAYYNRAVCHMQIGNLNLAIADLASSISLKPSAPAYLNRAYIYEKLGLYDAAVDDLTAAIAIDPSFPESFNNRGAALRQKGELARAVQDFDRAIMLDPDSAMAYNNRAKTFAQLGQLERAIDDFTRAIAIRSAFTEAYLGRADAEERLGRLTESASDYRRALELDPGNANIRDKVRRLETIR